RCVPLCPRSWYCYDLCGLVSLPGACDSYFIQAEDGIRDFHVTGVQTCALPISPSSRRASTIPSTSSRSLRPRPVRRTQVTARSRSEERRVGNEARSTSIRAYLKETRIHPELLPPTFPGLCPAPRHEPWSWPRLP